AELLHERLILGDDAWTSDPILRSERASREQRDPHRGKISAADQGAVGRQSARGVEALLSSEAKSRTARPTDRQVLNGSRRAHVWKALDALKQLLDEVGALRRARVRQEQPHGQNLPGLEAGIDANEVRERSEQQAGANQQHDRDRHLAHDERVPQSMMMAVG